MTDTKLNYYTIYFGVELPETSSNEDVVAQWTTAVGDHLPFDYKMVQVLRCCMVHWPSNGSRSIGEPGSNDNRFLNSNKTGDYEFGHTIEIRTESSSAVEELDDWIWDQATPAKLWKIVKISDLELIAEITRSSDETKSG